MIRTTNWRTRAGKVRYIRLFRAWRRMRERVEGKRVTGNTGEAIWHGLEVEWPDFAAFRAWAVSAGYSRTRCSLDRIDSGAGYTAANCRWVTVEQNSRYSYDACLAGDYQSDPAYQAQLNDEEVPF